MQVPTTPKRGRGEHWIDKVAAGKGPDIASHITVWAERCKQMELTLKAQLPAFVLPWHRVVPLAVRIGSSGKVLFMHLLVHHVNKVVRMHFEDGAGEFGEHWFVRVIAIVTFLQFCGGQRLSSSVDGLHRSVNESLTSTVLS